MTDATDDYDRSGIVLTGTISEEAAGTFMSQVVPAYQRRYRMVR